MLESETKKMEEKLELVKKMMELEKQKRSSQSNKALWREANINNNGKKGS